MGARGRRFHLLRIETHSKEKKTDVLEKFDDFSNVLLYLREDVGLLLYFIFFLRSFYFFFGKSFE